MHNLNEDNITQAVLEMNAQGMDQRLRALVTSIVQHLHAFAREVQLTEEEWFKGIQSSPKWGISRRTRGRNSFSFLTSSDFPCW